MVTLTKKQTLYVLYKIRRFIPIKYYFDELFNQNITYHKCTIFVQMIGKTSRHIRCRCCTYRCCNGYFIFVVVYHEESSLFWDVGSSLQNINKEISFQKLSLNKIFPLLYAHHLFHITGHTSRYIIFCKKKTSQKTTNY